MDDLPKDPRSPGCRNLKKTTVLISQDSQVTAEGLAMRSKLIWGAFIMVLAANVPMALADTPRVAPVDTVNHGQGYGQWAADWWQWAFGVPGPVNPLLDTTGEHCQQRQVDDVWFLGGALLSADPVVRTCEIPYGKSLFFPLINTSYGAFLNDPPETTTEEFVREASKCAIPVSSLSLIVDGFAVPRLDKFFTGEGGNLSPITSVQMPPNGVLEFLFGLDETIVPELVLHPFAEEGYYVFLKPLSPGDHIIQWFAEGCFPGFSQDVTYYVTVTTD